MNFEKQERHERLIELLGQFAQYQNKDKAPLIKIRKGQLNSNDVKDLDINEINSGVVVLTDFLNLGGGSISNIDLYRLLQAYFLVPERRDGINQMVEEAMSYRYQNSQREKK